MSQTPSKFRVIGLVLLATLIGGLLFAQVEATDEEAAPASPSDKKVVAGEADRHGVGVAVAGALGVVVGAVAPRRAAALEDRPVGGHDPRVGDHREPGPQAPAVDDSLDVLGLAVGAPARRVGDGVMHHDGVGLPPTATEISVEGYIDGEACTVNHNEEESLLIVPLPGDRQAGGP